MSIIFFPYFQSQINTFNRSHTPDFGILVIQSFMGTLVEVPVSNAGFKVDVYLFLCDYVPIRYN